MTAGEVLQRVVQAARSRQFSIKRHAFDRMDQRGVTESDVRQAMMSATGAEWDSEKETWRLTGGTDLEAEGLIVCVAVDWNVAVVTVFWE